MPASVFYAIPGQDIHWITLIGLIVALVGFFYVSYEVLDRPHGLLRMILLFTLLVLIPLVVISLPILLLTFFFWWNVNFREVGLTIALIFALSSGMVGGFYGTFATFHELYQDFTPSKSGIKKHFFSRATLLSWQRTINVFYTHRAIFGVLHGRDC